MRLAVDNTVALGRSRRCSGVARTTNGLDNVVIITWRRLGHPPAKELLSHGRGWRQRGRNSSRIHRHVCKRVRGLIVRGMVESKSHVLLSDIVILVLLAHEHILVAFERLFKLGQLVHQGHIGRDHGRELFHKVVGFGETHTLSAHHVRDHQ